MSNYITEVNKIYQNRYGHYCNKCKDLNTIPVSYHEFKQQYIDNDNNLLQKLKDLKSDNSFNVFYCSHIIR